MYQRQVAIGFNPLHIVVGSSEHLKMKGPKVTAISSAAADILNQGLDDTHKQLRQEAKDLCPDTSQMALPLIRAVNHMILLINDSRIYRFRLFKCPDTFCNQW